MSKVSTNVSLDADLKAQSSALFAELGMDLSTAVSLFLRQSLRVRGLPFPVTLENPNAETAAALNEYSLMRDRPDLYRRYASFREAMEDTLKDA